MATSPYGSAPLLPNPTGNDFDGNPIPYDPRWYPTQATAETLAKQTGGKVVDTSGSFANNQPQFQVKLPNGGLAYPGAIASLYTNPVTAGNQRIIDAETAKILNPDAPLTEFGNVAQGSANRQGTYSVSNGAISYDPNGRTHPDLGAPPISTSQYAAWLKSGSSQAPAIASTPAVTTPATGTPVDTSATPAPEPTAVSVASPDSSLSPSGSGAGIQQGGYYTPTPTGVLAAPPADAPAPWYAGISRGWWIAGAVALVIVLFGSRILHGAEHGFMVIKHEVGTL